MFGKIVLFFQHFGMCLEVFGCRLRFFWRSNDSFKGRGVREEGEKKAPPSPPPMSAQRKTTNGRVERPPFRPPFSDNQDDKVDTQHI